jgi:hypothetical protein
MFIKVIINEVIINDVMSLPINNYSITKLITEKEISHEEEYCP